MNISEQKCPMCNQNYVGLGIRSSVEMSVSQIHCSECAFIFSRDLDKEDLILEFEKELPKLKQLAIDTQRR